MSNISHTDTTSRIHGINISDISSIISRAAVDANAEHPLSDGTDIVLRPAAVVRQHKIWLSAAPQNIVAELRKAGAEVHVRYPGQDLPPEPYGPPMPPEMARLYPDRSIKALLAKDQVETLNLKP